MITKESKLLFALIFSVIILTIGFTSAYDLGYCGDSTVNQASEECDWGILNGFLCWAGYGSSCTYCTTSCKLKTITNYCSDGIKQDCEECDDKNLIDGDGCSSLCKIEGPPEPICGDGQCNGAETCSTCPGDCGVCPPLIPTCSDGTCNGAETCSTCPGDCGVCPPLIPTCGDGTCNGAETCSTCSTDCGVCIDTIKPVVNTKEPLKFSDAEVCSSASKNNSIEISIKEPDKGDEFEIGETINGTVKIKNKFEDDMDFDVEIYLYDINEEESIEEIKESVDIKDGKSEEIEFSIEIPDDIENEEFAIYAYVEGEDDECNLDYVEIEITRKKHEVIISDIITDRETVSPGEELEVRVKSKNLGKNDEDVFILVEIPSLNIIEKSEEIEIEKYGDKDRKTKLFYLNIPKYVSSGYYEIKASVIYEDGEDSKYKEFIIVNRISQTKKIEPSRVINLNAKVSATTAAAIQTTPSTVTPITTSIGVFAPEGLVVSGAGTPVVVGSGGSSTTKSKDNPIFRNPKTVSIGIKEKTQQERIPNVKIEFDGVKKLFKVNENQWVLFAIVLGLLIIVILILISVLRKSNY